MDTNRIKRFATEARNILKAGIAAKINTLGFDKNGNVAEENKPQLMQGGSLWNEQLQTEGFYYQWMSLYNRIQQKGINEVYEEPTPGSTVSAPSESCRRTNSAVRFWRMLMQHALPSSWMKPARDAFHR